MQRAGEGNVTQIHTHGEFIMHCTHCTTISWYKEAVTGLTKEGIGRASSDKPTVAARLLNKPLLTY